MKEIVHNALKGINQTVFAYGQTSSGKTYTMRGGKEAGLIPLSIKEIFDVINQDLNSKYKVKVSYLEVSINSSILALQRVHQRLDCCVKQESGGPRIHHNRYLHQQTLWKQRW